jgi:hypothetical protein
VLSAVHLGVHRAARPVGALLVVLAVGPLFGVLLAVSAKNAGTIRTLVAGIALGILGPVTLRWPRAGVVATMALLTCTGFLRRILIPVAGWSGSDPILLIGPAIAILLLVRRPGGSEPRSIGGALPALVAALLCITGLEVFNPEGGGLVAGVTGLLFIAAPLLWFFVGAWLGDDGLVAGLQAAGVAIASLAAGYGLWQTIAGFPSWDSQWIDVAGYTALQVGVIRAFSTFSSSAEYAIFVAAGVMVIAARAMRGRLLTLPALPLLVWALILESSRTVVVQGLAGILVMGALLAGSVRRAIAITIVGLAAIAVLDQLLAPHLLAIAGSTSDPLISHEAGGLGDPLNPEQSTVQIHLTQIVAGFALAFSHPLGLGTAGTNLAGLKAGTAAVGAEVDIPNQFISLGILGGVLYLVIVVAALAAACGLAMRRRDVVSLATVGILIVCFGQWLNGGYYALAPLVWLLIGSIGRSLWLASRSQRRPAGPSLQPIERGA